MTGGVEGTNLEGKKEGNKKIQTNIENRMESLTRMFAAGKDLPAEEDTEEEEES
jgi:hypothetical protein